MENVIVDHCSNLVARNSYSLTLLSYCHYQNWTGWGREERAEKGFSYDLNSAGRENGEIGDWDG